MADSAPRSHGRAAFLFIFITVALDMLALGLSIPVLPRLVEQFEGGNRADATSINGWFAFAFASMQFVFSPLLGALSDRYGRRPLVLLSNLGLGVRCCSPSRWPGPCGPTPPLRSPARPSSSPGRCWR